MPTKTDGEPPRISVPRQGTKSLLVVVDLDAVPVMDGGFHLAWHKPTGMFYVGGTGQPWNKSNLKTRDRLQAIFRFREWVRRNADDPDKLYITLEHELHQHPEIAEPERIRDIIEKREFVRYDMPFSDFCRTIREFALSDPEAFRQETGLRVVDEQPKPSVALSKILDMNAG